jgi:hypothetical protein
MGDWIGYKICGGGFCWFILVLFGISWIEWDFSATLAVQVDLLLDATPPDVNPIGLHFLEPQTVGYAGSGLLFPIFFPMLF